MGTCLFAYPDRLIPNTYVTTSLSGGSWVESGDISLGNLQDEDLSSLARSTNAHAAATVIDIDLGVLRDIRVVAILKHNLSLTAAVRLTFWSDSSHTQLVHDTGALPVWLPFYPPGSLSWGHPSLWDGKITDEDRDGYQFDFIRAFPAQVVARWVRLEISDQDNPDGYVELARCILAPAWQPPVNFTYGNTVGWETNATSDRAPSGQRYFDETARWRVATCQLEHLDAGIAAACVMEMQRRLGKSGELLFVYDPDAASQAEWQRSFLCTMDELSAIENPYFRANSAAFKLVEVL